jgi:predicted GNAT family acetyltransferase
MGWCTTRKQDEFATAAGSYLKARPVDNTLLLAALDDQADNDGALFGWLDRDGAVHGAFIHQPPRPVLASGVAPEAAAALADTLARLSEPVRGIDASAPAAEAFATTWRQRTGQAGQVRSHSRVYRLTGAVLDQPGEPGQVRTATGEDREVVADWLAEFGREVGQLTGTASATADDLLSRGGVLLWEVTDATPVAMAVLTPPMAGAVRITGLYTPRELRRHGYASAVLAAACNSADASEVLLITDASNAFNGNLRKRLGCEPIGDRLTLFFTPAPATRKSG